jgi:hypothetical protein
MPRARKISICVIKGNAATPISSGCPRRMLGAKSFTAAGKATNINGRRKKYALVE